MRRALWISVSLMGCGRLGFGAEENPPDVDGPVSDGATARCDPAKPFERLDALSTLNSSAVEGGLTLTDDGLRGMFWRTGAGGFEMWETRRASSASDFDSPDPTFELESGSEDNGPSLSGDGRTVVFSSRRDVGGGTSDRNLWIARRASLAEEFGAPEPLTDINALGIDNHAPYFVSSVGTVYHSTDWELYVATSAVAPALHAGVNAALDELNSSDFDTAPVVTADQRAIYFASTRGGGGTFDIWYSERASAADVFSAPKRLEGINSIGADDIPSWISPDQCELYLSKLGAAGMDLYVARRPL